MSLYPILSGDYTTFPLRLLTCPLYMSFGTPKAMKSIANHVVAMRSFVSLSVTHEVVK